MSNKTLLPALLLVVASITIGHVMFAEAKTNKKADENVQQTCDITASVKKFDSSSDIKEMVVVFSYTNRSESEPIDMKFPIQKRIDNFTDMALTIDGERAETIDPAHGLGDMVLEREVMLKPGQSFNLEVPIFDIYKVPDNWEVMTVMPVRNMAADGYTAGVVIQNQRREAKQDAQ